MQLWAGKLTQWNPGARGVIYIYIPAWVPLPSPLRAGVGWSGYVPWLCEWGPPVDTVVVWVQIYIEYIISAAANEVFFLGYKEGGYKH